MVSERQLIAFGNSSKAVRGGVLEWAEIFVMNANGTGLTQLTPYPPRRTVLLGSFSPDGQWIVFARFNAPHGQVPNGSISPEL